MKKIFSIIVFIIFIIMHLASPDESLIYSQSIDIDEIPSYHNCIDSTHKTCDGRCICDGMECIK